MLMLSLSVVQSSKQIQAMDRFLFFVSQFQNGNWEMDCLSILVFLFQNKNLLPSEYRDQV